MSIFRRNDINQKTPKFYLKNYTITKTIIQDEHKNNKIKMHTFLTRANALAAYTMSVLAGLTMVCFLSTFFLDYKTGSKINTVKVVVKHVPDYSASREKVKYIKEKVQP